MAEKQFKESRSCSQKGCVHQGLGPSLNKQKNHSFHESGTDGFSHLYIIKNLMHDQFDEADKLLFGGESPLTMRYGLRVDNPHPLGPSTGTA